MKKMFYARMICCVTLSLCLFSISQTARAYEQELQSSAQAIVEQMTQAQKTNLGIIDFTDAENDVTALGKFLSEEMAKTLSGMSLDVKDRSYLRSILREHQLVTTDLPDPQLLPQLREWAGIDVLIVGTLNVQDANVELSVKILDTANAETLAEQSVEIPKSDRIESFLREGLESKIEQAQTFSNSTDFFDDFSMGPKPDWNVVSGDWTTVKGLYTVVNIQNEGRYSAFIKDRKWTDLVMSVDVKLGRSHEPRPHLGWKWCSLEICPRVQDGDNAVCLWLGGSEGKVQSGGFHIKKDGNWGQSMGDTALDIPFEQVAQIRIEVENNVYTAYVNGKQFTQIYDTTFPSGSIGLEQYYQRWIQHKQRSFFDNVKISPLK